jgi:uncharacterized protein
MRLPAILVLVSVSLSGAPAVQVAPRVEIRAVEFPLSQVRLLPGPFKDAMDRDGAYLLQLNADRLLAGFRQEAGLPPKAKPYGGWELEGVAGHSLGHYLSAIAMMYAATGDERYKDRAAYIVAQLAECQAKNGNGYVGAIPKGAEAFAQIEQGNIRALPFNLNGIWVPWYTEHKVLAGLRDVALHCGNEQAAQVLVRLADWTANVVARLNDQQIQTMLVSEQGGMNEVLTDVYAMTGNQKYLLLAQKFNHRAVLDPLSRQIDDLWGLHSNMQVPKVIGAARQYEFTALPYYRDAAAFYWDTMTKNHSYVTGGNSDDERLGAPGKLSRRLSETTSETCNTYNLLKLTRHLYSWDPQERYMAFYERALFNQILGSQDPKTGMFCYYDSVQMGGEKKYSTPEDSFWCCVGSGMENHAKYGETIYSHDKDGVWVNLFIASELDWPQKQVRLRQETRFPEQASTRLVVEAKSPVDLAMRIRYPLWAAAGFGIKVNGAPQKIEGRPGGYVTLNRTWKNGDVVDVALPMRLHLEATQDDPERQAILYGPLVLAGELGTQPKPNVPVMLAKGKAVNDWVQPVGDKPLTFATKGAGAPKDVTLVPYSQMHSQHFSVYWDVINAQELERRKQEAAAAATTRKRLEDATVDVVFFGQEQSEKAHNLQSERSRTGDYMGHQIRSAEAGWFSFDLKPPQGKPAALVCTYWGGDARDRAFNIFIDGKWLTSQRINNDKPGEYWDVRYDLPSAMVDGRPSVQVKLESIGDQLAGRATECRTVDASTLR